MTPGRLLVLLLLPLLMLILWTGNAAATPPLEPVVATYFYYWYDLPSGPHSTLLTDQPADADTSYLDVSWFKGQFQDMDSAGIDIVLAAYWGQQEPSSDVGLQKMSQAYDELVSEGVSPPSAAMFLDTGAIGQWPVNERDLTQPDNQARVYSMIHNFFSTIPQRQWANLGDDRPIIWLWATWFDGFNFDGSFFDYVNSHFEEDFGVRPFIVAEEGWKYARVNGVVDYSQPMPIGTLYNWGASSTGFKKLIGGVAEVGPGYDERELPGPGRSGRHRDREDGSFYTTNFALAAQSGAPIIAIETWNEFHEASDIADSVEYGRQYIDLTRQMVDAWKGRTTPTPEAPTSTPKPTFASTPTPTATPTDKALPPPPAAPTLTPAPAVVDMAPSPATPVLTAKGDADCSGQTTIEDVIGLLQTVGQFGHRAPPGCTPDLDVDCDGQINAEDALIELHAFARHGTFPQGCSANPASADSAADVAH